MCPSRRVRRRYFQIVSLALGALAFSSASQAAAGDKRPVYVEGPGCSAAPIDQVLPLLRVELGPSLVETPSPEALRVTLECSDNVVFVSVTAPDRAPQRRAADLAGSPANVRARIVALQIAELVRELLLEPPVVRESGPAILPERVTSLEDRGGAQRSMGLTDKRVELVTFGQASSFRQDGRLLWGGGLRFDYAQRWMCAGFDAALSTRQDTSELGTSRTLLSQFAPHIAWRWAEGRTIVRLGAGYAFGVARIIGRTTEPSAMAATVSGPWAAPYALGALSCALTETVRVDLRGEMGWVTLPVVGQIARGRDVEIGGLWTTVQVGAALAF
jgi:hypothetical protein